MNTETRPQGATPPVPTTEQSAGAEARQQSDVVKKAPPGLSFDPPVPETVPVPFGTLGRGYATVADVKLPPAHLHVTRADHPGAGRERQVIQAAVELECYNAVKDDGGLAAGSALLEEKQTQPQFMVIGSSVTEEELPYVAGSGPDIEKAAQMNRHFAETINEFGGLTGVVQDNAIPAIKGAALKVLGVLQAAGRCAKEFQEIGRAHV